MAHPAVQESLRHFRTGHAAWRTHQSGYRTWLLGSKPRNRKLIYLVPGNMSRLQVPPNRWFFVDDCRKSPTGKKISGAGLQEQEMG